MLEGPLPSVPHFFDSWDSGSWCRRRLGPKSATYWSPSRSGPGLEKLKGSYFFLGKPGELAQKHSQIEARPRALICNETNLFRFSSCAATCREWPLFFACTLVQGIQESDAGAGSRSIFWQIQTTGVWYLRAWIHTLHQPTGKHRSATLAVCFYFDWGMPKIHKMMSFPSMCYRTKSGSPSEKRWSICM